MNDDQQFNLPLSAEDAESSSSVFLTDDHQQLLEQLAYSAQFNGGIQVVEGELDSGKTTLARLLCDDYLGQQRCALITADESETTVLEQAAAVLEVSAAESSAPGELLVQLRHQVQALQASSEVAILVIDDAHKLDQQTLSAFASLLQGATDTGFGLHLVLWSEPGLVERLDELGLVDIPVHDFAVPPLQFEDAQAYLLFAGMTMEADELRALWSQSGGRTGTLVRLLVRDETSPLEWQVDDGIPAAETQQRAARWSFMAIPRAHLAALGVLVAVLVVALVAHEPEPEAGDSRATAAIDLVAPDAGETLSQAATLNDEERSGNPSRAAIGEALTLEPVVADDELRQAIYGSPSTPVPPSHEVSGEGVSANERTSELEVTQVSSPSSVAEPQEQPEGYAQSQAANVNPTQTELSPASGGDISRIMALNPQHYSLQIMGASSEAALKQFREQQTNRDQLFLYQARRQGKSWYVLLAGEYASHAAASKAVSTLPLAQQKSGPWPRKLESIQQEIGEVQ